MREKKENLHQEIQTIIREYYEKLYTNKLDNTEKIEKYRETFNQETETEIENMD